MPIKFDPPAFDCTKRYYLGDLVTYKGDLLCLYPDGFRKVDNHEHVELDFENDYEFKNPICVKDPFVKMSL